MLAPLRQGPASTFGRPSTRSGQVSINDAYGTCCLISSHSVISVFCPHLESPFVEAWLVFFINILILKYHDRSWQINDPLYIEEMDIYKSLLREISLILVLLKRLCMILCPPLLPELIHEFFISFFSEYCHCIKQLYKCFLKLLQGLRSQKSPRMVISHPDAAPVCSTAVNF